MKSLRVFRFADRFNFEIDPSIYEAAGLPDIQALMNKQEAWQKRTELEKISFGRQPEKTYAMLL